jgi:pimeloyl-ACP methyl ester carboxylesterase
MNTNATSAAKVTYHTTQVDGLNIFHREAGDPGRPVIVLLHGFPTSSHMFRELIPALASEFRVLAPDYPGFGRSDAPAAEAFTYTFDHLAEIIAKWLEAVGVTRFFLYMQDYGGPVGFRIAEAHPKWIRGLWIQNANAYIEGVNMAAFAPIQAMWAARSPETEAPVRGFLAAETTRFQYLHGVRRPEAVSPDAWTHDQALLDRPGNDRIQLDLLYDYRNNPARYEGWHEYLRRRQPPALITWGRNDPLFTPAGAEAFRRDLPSAEVHFFETGHFALEEDGAPIAAVGLDFLRRHA